MRRIEILQEIGITSWISRDALQLANTDNQKALNLVNTLIRNTKDLGLPASPESVKMFDKLTARTKEINAGIATLQSVKVVQVKG